MKRHLNTLYVTTQGAYLGGKGETLLVRVEDAVKLRVPLHMLQGVICFGRVGVSPALLGRCADRGIEVSFLTMRGRFLARVVGRGSGNVLLRRSQYRLADDLARSADIARVMVGAKIANSLALYRRARSDHGSSAPLSTLNRVIAELKARLRALQHQGSLDAIRGTEGRAGRVYFSGFNAVLRCPDESLRIDGRSRRPPRDPVNALLSFVYTLLRHDVESALAAVGLDPQVGFLHRDRPGRPGLALDLMEEFRAYLADRLVLSLLNRRQLDAKSFQHTESGAVGLTDEARSVVLKSYQERKERELTHRYLDEKMTAGMLVHVQALLLARHIRGDIAAYPAFFWR